ncbi:MAG TPA: hypothetical protein VHV78_01660 [Gemmatimonadaceae bacterium]|nr:hypothetical protein [Gemmatimonadaceae bacterium]
MAAKAARRRVPALLLLVAAFAPDVVQMIFDVVHRESREISHSLVSVAIGATLLSLGYWLFARARAADALAVWMVYALHWPADFITGLKPTWPGGPLVGRFLYAQPARDAAVECALILICWVGYWLSLPPSGRARPTTLALPWILIALQLGFDYSVMRGISWV